MDFHLSKEQEMVRKMYREFAENEVKPLAEEIDEEERFPMETVEKMGKLGMMGIYFPKEYGGAGGDGDNRQSEGERSGAEDRHGSAGTMEDGHRNPGLSAGGVVCPSGSAGRKESSR